MFYDCDLEITIPNEKGWEMFNEHIAELKKIVEDDPTLFPAVGKEHPILIAKIKEKIRGTILATMDVELIIQNYARKL